MLLCLLMTKTSNVLNNVSWANFCEFVKINILIPDYFYIYLSCQPLLTCQLTLMTHDNTVKDTKKQMSLYHNTWSIEGALPALELCIEGADVF